MSETRYDKMPKKALIDRLIKAERQLRTVAAEIGSVKSPAARRRPGKQSGLEKHPDPTSVPKKAKRAGSARPASENIKSASESDYTILDRDGQIRRLYKVVKDIRDDAGNPLFSEGAIYEINSKSRVTSDIDHPDIAGESDQTELICRFRPNGTLTYVNEAYCRYFGFEKGDLRGRNILLSISEADREQVYSRLKDLRPERPVDTLEYRVATVFGDILWNQWTYRALFDDSGNILEYQSVGRDITFRKYTQDVLEKRAAILEAVTFAAEGFLKGASWRDRIERVLERFGAAMNASYVFLCENDVGKEGDIAVLRSYEWYSPQIKGAGNRKKFLRNSELAVRFSRWVHEKSEGRPIFGTIGQFPDREVGDLALDKKLSIAVVPVMMGERWWGFIGFADYSGEIQWSEDEIAPLGAASEILSAAVEREEKEKALAETHATIRDQERFLAGVFDGIQDGLSVLAPDLTILRVNSTMEKWFSDAAPLVGKKCFDAYRDRKRPCRDCPIKKTLETGKAASHVFPKKSPGGEIKAWLEIFSYPWIDEKTGAMRGVIEYVRDITEKKRAEEARLRSEERLLTFLNSSQDKIFLKDEQRRYLFMNEACLSFLGRTLEETIGKTDDDIFTPVHAEEIRKWDLRVSKGKKAPELYQQRSKDRVLETTKFRVNLEDGRTGIGGIIRDITKRVQAEQEIAEWKQRYEFVAASSGQVVYDCNFVHGEISWSGSLEQVLGYQPSEMAGGFSQWEELIDPRDRDETLRLIEEAEKKAEPFEAEYGFRHKDGHYVRILDRGFLMPNPSGKPERMIGSMQDITERKRAEEALRQQEAMMRSILRAAPVGIAFGRERTLQWSNEYYQRMTGYGEDDVSGRTARLLYESEEEFQKVGKALYGNIGKDGIGETQTRWKRKDGSMIDVLLSVSPLDSDHVAQGVVISALDVTEKKKADEALRASEARYRELADHLPIGIYESDFEGTVNYANNTSMEMFGYSVEEVAAGVNFLAVIAPEDRETAIRNTRSIREGTPLVYQEYTMLRRDGSRFPTLTRARPMVRDGRIVGSSGIVTDISELKQVQKALRKNEALLGSILQAAPIGVGMVHDRVIAWVNEGMTGLTGYGGDELMGKSARIVYLDDEEFERAGREKYAEIKVKGRGAVETRWKRKDGTIIDVHLSSAPIDPTNLAAGVVFTALDITAQKKAARILLFAKADLERQVAEQTQELDISNMLLKIELEEHRKTEEALVNSEQLYRAIVEDQTEFICRFHPDGTISFVNEAFCRFFGKKREELLGTRYRPMPPEDQRMVRAALRSLNPENPVVHVEFRTELPDGEIRWMQWSNRAIYDESGTLVEHQAVGRDITDRKRSELQIRESRNMLRAVFDGISDPLVMVREDMTLIMLNRSALRVFGASQYRDIIGSPCLDYFQGRYGQEASGLVRSAIAEERPARYELETRGDSARYEEVFVYPVHANSGDHGMAIIRITDRTKQRLMERELIQSEKLASLGLLISGIVHEINNPNNFISFNIPILQDYLQEILPVLDEHAARMPYFEVQGMPYAEFRTDVLKLLDNIEHGSTRINTTVAKLKEFSRRKDEKGARPILPTGIVEKAIAICHTQIRKTVKTFDVQIEQDMPEMVSDPDAIEQTLINLLINAAQAADKPDSHIRLEVRRGASGKEGLVLTVDDNGCGMEAKTASRIFDPFFTTKEEGLGTGLGLYISKNLLESVGGSISVESEIGRGTIFRVVIPDMGDPDRSKKTSEQ